MTPILVLDCDEMGLGMVKGIRDAGDVLISLSALCGFARLHFGGNGRCTEPIC